MIKGESVALYLVGALDVDRSARELDVGNSPAGRLIELKQCEAAVQGWMGADIERKYLDRY